MTSKLKPPPGPVKTLGDIKDRCTEVGTCWEWQGRYTDKTPQVYFDGRDRNVRRVALMLHTGKNLAERVVLSTCGNPKCVNPAHLGSLTKRENMAYIATKTPPAKRQAASRLAARKNSRITELIATEVRNSDESCKDVAKRLGISPRTASAIRRGEQHMPNIWAALMPSANKPTTPNRSHM